MGNLAGTRTGSPGSQVTRRTHCAGCIQDAIGWGTPEVLSLQAPMRTLMASSRRPEHWQWVNQVALLDPRLRAVSWTLPLLPLSRSNKGSKLKMDVALQGEESGDPGGGASTGGNLSLQQVKSGLRDQV